MTAPRSDACDCAVNKIAICDVNDMQVPQVARECFTRQCMTHVSINHRKIDQLDATNCAYCPLLFCQLAVRVWFPGKVNPGFGFVGRGFRVLGVGLGD